MSRITTREKLLSVAIYLTTIAIAYTYGKATGYRTRYLEERTTQITEVSQLETQLNSPNQTQ